MTSRINPDQADWFRSWIETDETFPENPFPRRIVLLHPGTELVDDDRFPFASPSIHGPADDPLSPEQAAKVDQILLETAGPDTACSFALYAGYLHEDNPDGLQAVSGIDATWHRGRLNHLLFNGPLDHATFESTEQRWGNTGTLLELSYLWPLDRAWFLASMHDTAVTVIAGGNALAERLLAEPVLDAHEWRA